MKIYCSCIAFLLINLVSFTSCGNSERQVKLLSDMYTHSGKLRGYAFVYEANGAGDYQMSDSTFPVYENEDGTFSIEYNGKSCGLSELETPIAPYNDGAYLFRYQIDYNHFIEKIPTSY